MKKEIDMLTQSGVLYSTYLWLGIFLVCAAVFFSVAIWVIVRGGKDVLEILTEARGKK